MNKVQLTTIISILTLLLSIQSLSSPGLNTSEQKDQKEDIKEVKRIDKKAKILAKYLEEYNSPLQYHAQDFLDAANQYDLDWKLLPSIAGVESTFGKRIPGGYNAYGWGVYGTNRIYFKSWRDGMFTVAKGLRENYVNRGYNDPYEMNRIYAASPTWGVRVSYFMNDLDNFSRKYRLEEWVLDSTNLNSKTAVTSGMLAYKGI